MGIDAVIFAISPHQINREEYLNLCYKIVDAFGPQYFIIHRPDNNEGFPPARPLYLSDDNKTVHVNTLLRYYGPNYERGPAPIILSMIKWMKTNIGATYYGPDCGEPILMTNKEETFLWNHFLHNGHHPYRRIPKDAPKCDWCEIPMHYVGFRGKYNIYMCPICNIKTEKEKSNVAVS